MWVVVKWEGYRWTDGWIDGGILWCMSHYITTTHSNDQKLTAAHYSDKYKRNSRYVVGVSEWGERAMKLMGHFRDAQSNDNFHTEEECHVP